MAGRKLKVFQAQFGFYDSVVGAPSQAAALRAWDTHQNLFASGDAGVTADEAAMAAALAHPETPLFRAIGSNDPFRLEPTGLPKVPAVPKRLEAKAQARPKVPVAPRSPADRTALDAAEGALRKLDHDRKREEADFRRREDELVAENAQARAAYLDHRKIAKIALIEAQQAYRKAGGVS